MADTAADEAAHTSSYFSAWTLYKGSRLKQFAKGTLDRDSSRQLDDYDNLERQWGRPLQSKRRIQSVAQTAEPTPIRDSDPDMCHRCCCIGFGEMIQNVDSWFDSAYHLGTFSDIVASPQCSLCNLFSCLANEYASDLKDVEKQFYLAAFPTSALYADAWTWKVAPSREVSSTTSFSILDEVTFRDLSRIRQPELIRTIGCISPLVTDGNFSSFQARKLDVDLDISVVKAWLNYCGHNHLDTCTSSDRNLPYSVQVQVIDCRTRNVVSLSRGCTYLALSYVWGPSNGSGTNKDHAHDSLSSATRFPQTVEDAITLTTKLGYTYLWVDRYCIPQGDGLKRRLQISQMDRIYAGAEATIIAAAGVDPHYGLPGVSSRKRSTTSSATINNQLYTIVPPDPAHELRASRWNTRAWTYQESVLSWRRIFFCDRQVYFECSAMHCYEAMQAPLHLLHIPPCSQFSTWNEPGLFPVNEYRHALDQLFHHLALYTVRELSYPSDIFNGMLGVFAAFSRRPVAAKSNRNNQRMMQIAGIPIVPNDTLITYDPLDPPIYNLSREEQFITGLSWKVFEPAQRRVGFPSWSWLGWYGAVQPRNDYEGYIRNTHGLGLIFGLPEPLNIRSETADFKNTLKLFQSKALVTNYIPDMTITGTTVKVRVTERQDSIHVISSPSNLAAFVDTDDGYLACDRFNLHYLDPRLETHSFSEDCIGVILGMAQCTYFAGSGRKTRVLDDSKSPLVIMVLWERDGRWERLGLIEHEVRLRCDANPVPAGSGYLGLRTERRCLRLA